MYGIQLPTHPLRLPFAFSLRNPIPIPCSALIQDDREMEKNERTNHIKAKPKSTARSKNSPSSLWVPFSFSYRTSCLGEGQPAFLETTAILLLRSFCLSTGLRGVPLAVYPLHCPFLRLAFETQFNSVVLMPSFPVRITRSFLSCSCSTISSSRSHTVAFDGSSSSLSELGAR